MQRQTGKTMSEDGEIRTE